MEKLVYGRNNQVSFKNAEEKEEALHYLATSSNVQFVCEDNQNQGAWAQEHRFHFQSKAGIPECLDRQMTAGRGNIYGRINCKELWIEVAKRLN